MGKYFAWDRGLSIETFERALLLVGLLPPSIARLQALLAADELSSLLMARWQGLLGRPWAWRLRESTARLIQGPDEAVRLVEAANVLLARTGENWGRGGRGLRVEVNSTDSLDPLALSEALQRAGAHSVYVRSKAEGEMNWSWPLQIGLSRSSELLAGASSNSSLRPLFQEFHYEGAPVRVNLLLSEATLVELTKTITRSPFRHPADAVIVFGGVGETHTKVWHTLSLLSEATGVQGVFVFDKLDSQQAQWATEGLIAYLSRDLPMDSAVARLARDFGVSTIEWATRSLVEATSVREQGRLLARKLQQIPAARIRLDASSVRDLTGGVVRDSTPSTGSGGVVFGVVDDGDSAIWVSARELGASLENRLQPQIEGMTPKDVSPGGMPPLQFDLESHGARTLAKLARTTAREVNTEAARNESRYLQARVETRAGRTIKEKIPVLRGQEYFACVFIGVRDPTWLGLEQPFKAPEPPEGRPLMLDVLFWEPLASPTPQVSRLELRPRGNTGVVRFPFRTTADQALLSARIAVYHQNRNLQTGLLTGQVGNGPAGLHFTLDAMSLPKFIGLENRVGVGASIIVNDDASGKMQAFGYRDGQAAVAAVSDEAPASVDIDPSQAGALTDLTAALGRAITSITTNPQEYNDLSKEGTRTLLLNLALHGSALLTRLQKHSEMGHLFDQAKYIQIVMAHVDAFFPIEFIYDGEPPEDDAQVCRGKKKAATKALAEGVCCGAYKRDPTHTICPLRFWSTSKVIERHAHIPEHTRLSGQFQLRSARINSRERLLNPLQSAVVAASQEADTAVPDTVKNLRADLDAVIHNAPVPLAADWDSLEKEVASARPNLIVLLPHHLQEGGFDQLEIGGVPRKSMQIRQKYVISPKDPDACPIVLLIGCQTNAAKVDLEGFVPVFQDAGAVIVVSTIASILGRQAGPAAVAIAQELKKVEGKREATFGEVMLAVRRRLLAEGTPMVLGLTSYGDADWRIEAAPNNGS